ncbi:MAG TPA: pseudouridine synthase [Cyclobacteriaceae bacterium]
MDRPKSQSEKNVTDSNQSQPVRLNKFISNAGIASRRDADKLIQEGKVSVNGKIITELGTKVLRTDKVVYMGKTLKSEKPQYILLNKPKDFITTMEDPLNRKTVMKLVSNACRERIYPVGRLDRNTTGLLLFTNDGELATKLTHPSHMIKKVYQVDLNKPLSPQDFRRIQSGIRLEDGLAFVDEIAILSADKKIIGLEIHIGKNRVVRRIFEKLGYDVIKLDRVMFGPLTKKDLPRGKWRHLDVKELKILQRLS